MSFCFASKIETLPGIGPKRAKCFNQLGIETVKDLLYHFPRAYRNKGNIKLLSEADDGEIGSFILTLANNPSTVMLKNRMTLTKFKAFDDSGVCTVTYFNQSYLDKVFTIGSSFRFYGKVSKKGSKIELSSPEHEAYYEGKVLPDFSPLYPLSQGLTQNLLRSSVSIALQELDAESCMDIIPEKIRTENGIEELYPALKDIHQPNDFGALEKARKRFIFEELFVFAAAVSSAADKRQLSGAPVMECADIGKLYSALPYAPTRAQKRTIGEIEKDMCNPQGRPMARLVSGDVGCGKTLCACAAAYISCQNGCQSALMAPTEILASQHYNDLAPFLNSFGMNTALLTGSTKLSEKRKIYEGLANGSIDFIIGTHALISDGVEFAKLGLVITDEQHRFGVMQRAKLSSKSKNVHTLVMSATPIPRTLSLILYGDLDISAIDEMPPGRQRVDTFVVDESYRNRLNGFIRKKVSEGSQVYIVCPSIDSSDSDEEVDESREKVLSFDYGYDAEEQLNMPKLKSAKDYAEQLKNEVFPDFRIGLVHGKLKPNEKNQIMDKFVKGEIDVLVSTTVIEVGVNVPNAVLMIVENAERYGLSQLHQLRGRVGRGKKKAYCILVSDSKSKIAKERLSIMKNTYDGYCIAQKDLEMRGPGDFFPSNKGNARQSGAAVFKFANLCNDMDLLKLAFDSAKAICKDDPMFEKPENKLIRVSLEHLFEINKDTIN